MMRKFLAVAALAAAATVAAGVAVQAQPYGPGMMGGGYGYYGPLHMVIWAVILIAVVVGVVWLVRSMTASGAQAGPKRFAGLDVLEERYARGEIQRDEYLQKKKDITS